MATSSGKVRERKFKLPLCESSARIADSNSDLAVIVTHPWGPLGGNMNNNVVLAIAVWFQRLGITTLRFNFAGNQIGRGNFQVDNVKEAANFLLTGQHLTGKAPKPKEGEDGAIEERKAPSYILLVGYSYGSIICGSASSRISQCIATIMISPPLAVRHWLYMFNGNFHLEHTRKAKRPLLMMIGSQDNFTSEDAFMDIVHTMPQDTTTGALLKDADHFFRGREKDLMDIIGKSLRTIHCNGNNLCRFYLTHPNFIFVLMFC